MTTQQIAHHREEAEIFHGESICKKKSHELLGDLHLPKGLLPLDDIVEMGHNRTTGFVWLKQKRKKDHWFQGIGRTVSYEPEVTAFVEERRMSRVTGVKSKELFLWITIADIRMDDGDSGKITFANPSGLSKTFAASAFDVEDEQEEEERGNKKKKKKDGSRA